ncbi:MAG TPA: response regulator [Bryobacteraceae bacterium]|nr:response regulator [Bryobacteraceae bacterium]
MKTKFQSVEILLIEDFAPDASLFSQLLSDNSSAFRLSIVDDGEDALHFLRRNDSYADAPRPDLIFLDLNLPKRTGLEILEEIRANPTLRPTPVVILTSSENEKDVNAAYRSGANLYVKKPGTLDQLEELMQALSRIWLEYGELPRTG